MHDGNQRKWQIPTLYPLYFTERKIINDITRITALMRQLQKSVDPPDERFRFYAG
jgi:hypothetical protein